MRYHRSPRQAGFTFLELLVALGVTSLVVVLVFAGFGAIGRTDQRNQVLMERTDRMLTAQHWLQRKFDSLRTLSREEQGSFVMFFNGNAAGAIWVAPVLQLGPESSGLHVIRATAERDHAGRARLEVQLLPYDGARTALDWSRAVREVLVDDLQSLQWFYQDGRSGEWFQQWDAQRRYYPSRVRLELADSQGTWPPLVFTLPRAR